MISSTHRRIGVCALASLVAGIGLSSIRSLKFEIGVDFVIVHGVIARTARYCIFRTPS